MAKLAIKGHKNRGKEVIKILEMLGGENTYNNNTGFDIGFYYSIEDGGIRSRERKYGNFEYMYFTLEEFLEKFPYKIGDKVKVCGDNLGVIIGMRWEIDCVVYKVKLSKNGYETNKTSENLQPYKEEIIDTGCCSMPTTPPSYTLSVGDVKTTKRSIIFGSDSPNETELVLGDNFEIQVKDGKNYVVRKKPQYPKTYKECCKIVGFNVEEEPTIFGYKDELLTQFQHLLICRDAYWKIAGEQMGLGKSWEPDWSIYEHKFCLGTDKDKVIEECVTTGNRVLAFPTKEMRDAFYENFKELIESCKELL